MPKHGSWAPLDLAQPNSQILDRIAACHSVVHLAWGGLPHYQAMHHINEELPRHITFLDELCRRGLRSLVIAGTCLEYGMQEGEMSEDAPAIPSVPYAIAKNLLRKSVESICEKHNVRLTWARLFYLFGTGQSPTSLWSQLQACLDRGDVTFPMSAGQQIRDFMSVDIAAQILSMSAIKQLDVGIMNVCSGVPKTVEETVRDWMCARGKSVRLELGRYPYPAYEPFRFWGCRRKLDQLLRAM
jgi:dTDP-6-deoxy-L-talose 4-dehydrogenase (NAD+)